MNRHLTTAVLLFVLPAAGFAQSAVPSSLTYQGKISDGTGALVGSPTPVNRAATFRIYDAVTGGNRLYSERQTVTIAGGEFNVLVGGGNAVAGESNPTAFADLFGGAIRYLGVTVDDGNGNLTDDPEISPRQQFVTTPYAFRAKLAEGTTTGSISTAMIANNAVTATQLAPSAVTASKIGADVGLWSVNAGSTSRMSGNVGIGIANPGAPLSLGNALANTKLALWDDGSGSFYGMGIQANQFRFHTGGTGDRFSFLGGAAGPEVFTVKANGNVGIGVTNPVTTLQIHSPVNEARVQLQHPGTGSTIQGGLALIMSNKSYLWQYDNFPLLLGTNGATRVFIGANGNVAFGGLETPSALVSLGGGLANTKLAVWDNGSGATMGFGVQGSQFRFHVNQSSDRFAFFDSGAGSEVMSLMGNGSLGLGTAGNGVAGRFQIHSSNTDSRMYFTNQNTGSSSTDGLTVGHDTGGAFFWNHEPYTAGAASALRLATASAERLRIEGDGRMGFNAANGDPNLGYYFQTPAGYMMVLANGTSWRYSFDSAGGALKYGSTTWANFSDRRLKTNIDALGGSLEQLLKLRSVTFDWKDPEFGRERSTGFIAQEVESVFPNWVKPGPGGHLTVELKGFEAHTVQALRELRAEKDVQISRRDAKIAALEQRIQELETETGKRLAAIERRLSAGATAAVNATPTR